VVLRSWRTMSKRTLVVAAIAGLDGASCGDDFTGPPAHIDVMSGDAQSGPAGSQLANPLVVRVTDAGGRPVAGQPVVFRISSGGGSADSGFAFTDDDGLTQDHWKLGPTVGVQRLDAVVGATSATFTANAQSVAQVSDAAVAGRQQGITPFIEFVQLRGTSLARLVAARFTIAAKPGTASKPVEVTHTIGALQRRGYVAPGSVTVPVFGLYSGTVNDVSVQLRFDDASSQELAVSITTAAYTDPNSIYDRPTILTKRVPGTALGFDFFMMKNLLGSPVILDSDGELRWVGAGVPASFSSIFNDGGFVIGAATTIWRLELDGSMTEASLLAPRFTAFHHNIDPGKKGLLVELDANDDGVPIIESNLAEITSAGMVLEQWDLGALIGDYMRSQGDDADAFIRPGVDWFHMNGATYDPRDDRLIVSSREHFLIKIDYTTGALIWILGDPTKYWFTFPSLRAKALTLEPGEFYPIGQHAPSITSDGLLMVFNNGFASLNQPAGAPMGENRMFSAVSAYAIDETNRTAREAWRFDYGQTLLSIVCSSAYEAADQSILLDYATASNLSKARLVALDRARRVVFDFEFSSSSCNTSWNAKPIALDHLVVE
jgi:arylsulfate sulfotransferase